MKFNKQQQEAIDTINGNIAVIATAGSGKTSVLVHRIENMINNHNINPSSILAITFSRKAKDNVVSRLEKLGIHNVNIETFHSFALKIIISVYGANRYKVWTTQWEKEKAIQDICTSLQLCEIEDVPYNGIMTFIALQKVHMKKPTDSLIYPSEMPFQAQDMKCIYKRYEDFKDDKSYIEFDDFLNIANEILDENEDVLNVYQSLSQYVLVDEFQDISLSQALLLKKINTDNTMIVGDPLQAIYSFRGGDSRFILDFDSDYKDVKVINLNTNYRCSANIVETANRLALCIPDSQHRHYVESVANKDGFKTPELRLLPNDKIEAEWIAKQISRLKIEGYNYNDIAVLARTNAQLQRLETSLHDSNISFDVVDGKLFTDLPEIKLILSYFKLAANVNDDEAFSYLYNKPHRWLNKKFYEEVELNSKRKNIPLYKAMFSIDRRNWRFKNGIDEIIEVITHIQRKDYTSVTDLVHYLRNRLEIDKFVTKGKQSDDGSYIEQIDNLDSFENMCEKYTSIEELLTDLNDLNKEVETDSDEKVKLLTIHKSKGLEFPVVFVIGCNNGLLPHYKNTNIDDERRLFYVAITRAEKELYLTYTKVYNNQFKDVSPFIMDIQDVINVVNPSFTDKKIEK